MFSIGCSGVLLVAGVADLPMAMVGGGQLAPVVGLQGGNGGSVGGFVGGGIGGQLAFVVGLHGGGTR